MFTNELKKGAYVQLNNGWMARIEDNLKGNTRLATVYGHYTEMGSVYSHDIMVVFVPDENGPAQIGVASGTFRVERIEHTPAQIKLRKIVSKF